MAGETGKEAMVICLDVGPSMNQAPAGHETCLETSIKAISRILQRKVFADSKDEVALVLFGTPNTGNELAEDEEYQNITVAKPMGPATLDLLEYVVKDIQASNISADFVDALVVSMDLLEKSIKGKKFSTNRIVLFSDLGGEFSDDQLEPIINGLKSLDTELNLIGPDFDAEDEDDDEDNKNGMADGASNVFHRKEKTPQQRAGEALMKHILEAVDGTCYSFSDALGALSFFQCRSVKQTAWKCKLEIGPDLKIPACGYHKTKEGKMARSWGSTYIKGAGKEYSITNVRSYHLNNEEETEISQDDLVKGYRYGSDIIPMSKEDMDNMAYKSGAKCFKVLGFTKADNIKRHHYLGDGTMSFVSDPGDQAAGVAMSALIQALYETNMVAIVKKVYSSRSQPRIGFLSPHIKAKYECLYFTELPFSEDVRQYTFSSLSANKKHQPTDEQLSAVDDLITSMDLFKSNEDEDDEKEEAFKPKLTFNPYLQRAYQCLQHRALNPNDPLPEIDRVVESYLEPPKEVLTSCEPQVEKLKKLFKLERVVKKKEDKTGENLWKDGDVNEGAPAKKPKLDEDGDFTMESMAKGKVTEVGTVDPVKDFKTIISQKHEDRFTEAAKQMQERIRSLVLDSFRDQFYDKAMECLKVLREESAKLGEPDMFNSFLKEFKETLTEKNKTNFWDKMYTESLTLIDSSESSETKVTKQEAKKFLEGEEKKPKDEPVVQEDDEPEDLLAMM
ncbi:X-ray repair cross-complementing protein 5-like [Ptychodera flava]|uniref:X-ray repair cross-complementing protein 5-like n=1 Tax=Ptychodera flava TaxID=63121 RepID=UPI00396A2340